LARGGKFGGRVAQDGSGVENWTTAGSSLLKIGDDARDEVKDDESGACAASWGLHACAYRGCGVRRYVALPYTCPRRGAQQVDEAESPGV
jgi:hypothetical protein